MSDYNRRVLVIDDNEAIHRDFRKILCPAAQAQALDQAEAALFGSPAADAEHVNEAFDLDGALQGERGFELVGQAVSSGKPYAVAFVDMRMPPGWDGLETIEHLWRADPDVQVVICTAYSDYSWDQVTERLGRSDNLLLLKKPFDNTEVWQLACALSKKWNLGQRVRVKLRESEHLTNELQQINKTLQQEIVERRTAEDLLRHNAYHDSLTGLPNRAYLMERLAQCLKRRDRHSDYRFAILFLDVDNFKLVNDGLGHNAGDQLLIQVADRLRTNLRALDTVAYVAEESAVRLGGDEFIVLLDGIAKASDSARVAQRLNEQLSCPFEVEGQHITISVSIGIAVSEHGYAQPDEILRDADIAMYRAKTAGKARYAMFEPEMHRVARTRLQMENDLREAIPNNELHLVYQPIVELPSRRIVAFEALLRWERGPHAGTPPGTFIPVAEESGLITTIGRWVIDNALEQAREWRRQLPLDKPIYVSVNVSRRQLFDTDLAAQVSAALKATALAGGWLTLEVTEGGVIEDFDLAAHRLQELKRLGVALHMDDFGTGYSSLSCLHRLPFDVVKIDQAFTATMKDNPSYAAVINSVVTLAHNLGMKVTVEGVETDEQLKVVTDLRCDFAQGFYFSQPVEGPAAIEMLRRGAILQVSPISPASIQTAGV